MTTRKTVLWSFGVLFVLLVLALVFYRKEIVTRLRSPPCDFFSCTQTSATRDYAAGFANADDLLTFAESIFPAAQSGDAAAQFYLYRVDERCGSQFHALFRYAGRFPDGKARTPEEALVALEAQGFATTYVRPLFEQCRRYDESGHQDLQGNWLGRSADARYPLALATMARAEVPFIWPEFGPSVANRDVVTRIRDRSLTALRSKDPAVIHELAYVVNFLTPGETSDAEMYSWVVAACLRGFDCGRTSEPYRRECILATACSPDETALDVYRRKFRSHFAALERRAREINLLIDEERFEKTGFEHFPGG